MQRKVEINNAPRLGGELLLQPCFWRSWPCWWRFWRGGDPGVVQREESRSIAIPDRPDRAAAVGRVDRLENSERKHSRSEWPP